MSANIKVQRKKKVARRQRPQKIVVKEVVRKSRNNNRRKPKDESVGSKIGSFVGHGIQQVIKAITGFGDYNIDQNSLMNGGLQPPEIINSQSKGAFIVRHREYIADVKATTAFTNVNYDINPGLVNSFPWLSQVASAFEEYNLRGLVYEFKSMSSDAVLATSATSALGTVIMATQYNSLVPNFTSKLVMENYEFANSDKPSNSFLHPVECSKLLNPLMNLYIRTGSVPANADQRLYDLGNFQIATVGMQASSGVIGELWCTFEIELHMPKLLNAQGLELLTDHYQLGTVANSTPLGTTSVLQPNSSLGTSISVGYELFFPSTTTLGNYLFNYSVVGGSTSISGPSISTTNCSFLTIYNGDTSSSIRIPNSTTTTTLVILGVLSVTGVGASMTFSTSGTLPSSVTSGDLWITQINSSITT
jgi:hypothetical protein